MIKPKSPVAHRPENPLMLYDGDCRFCVFWIRRWQRLTGVAVEYRRYQDAEVALLLPELAREKLESAVHFIGTDGAVCAGAEAVFRCLAENRRWRWPLWIYGAWPGAARLSETAYQLVARHRTAFSALTRLLWGVSAEPPAHEAVRWLFLRGMAAIYLIAIASLWVQLPGLIGSNGILPAKELMAQAGPALDQQGVGLDRYRMLPTLCWLGSSDGFLQGLCGAGAGLALMAMFGLVPQLCFGGLWLVYLSLATVGREFFGFQWDNLLLEAGLLAVVLAPSGSYVPGAAASRAPLIGIWLLRLLLFKLMFMSGVVKLMSGDAAWRDGAALMFHYETQPLPTWIGWYVHQLPEWAQRASCVVMFAIELVVPWLLFAPRRLRIAAAAVLGGLQFLILLTGNYTFFNWLTLLLCVAALDDAAVGALLPKRLRGRFADWGSGAAALARGAGLGRRVVLGVFAAVVLALNLYHIRGAFGRPAGGWASIVAAERWLVPLRSFNRYGLFAVMTTSRPEIVVEGSRDGTTWLEYEFKHKPGALGRRPGFVAPHQPRLDWQMWFAALGDFRQNPWFLNFCGRLLEGAPAVLELLAENPFGRQPPAYVRARLYDYRFTTVEERRASGAWWKRELRGEYLPVITLRGTGELAPAPEPQ